MPQLQDLIMIVAIGFRGMGIATLAAPPLEQWAPFFSATVWKMVVVTALAAASSGTRRKSRSQVETTCRG
ncbi:MAG: hypothetical protein ACO39S_08105, partial [Steroidobacteraceae bacterium]